MNTAVLDRVREAFARNESLGYDVGASVAVWQGGEEVLCLSHGWRDGAKTLPWESDTLCLIWSATKGLASSCVLHALDQEGIDLDTRVAFVWPEFGQNGKEDITLAEALSHRAGLSALEDRNVQLLDYPGVIAAIEKQAPVIPPGMAHAYGPRTFGFVADEILRRVTGIPVSVYWRTHFADPLGLDAWIGLPEEYHSRVAQMLPPRAHSDGGTEEAFNKALADGNSLTRRAFSTPASTLSPTAMNAPAIRAAQLPSLGGIASARALAKFYSFLANGAVRADGPMYSDKALAWFRTPLANGLDQTLLRETAFSAGFMMDPRDETGRKTRAIYGPSMTAFGHPGAGGSLAFADPETGIGFAYVMNQMELGVLPRTRAQRLVQALYDFA